jgi:hypothetical protein
MKGNGENAANEGGNNIATDAIAPGGDSYTDGNDAAKEGGNGIVAATDTETGSDSHRKAWAVSNSPVDRSMKRSPTATETAISPGISIGLGKSKPRQNATGGTAVTFDDNGRIDVDGSATNESDEEMWWGEDNLGQWNVGPVKKEQNWSNGIRTAEKKKRTATTGSSRTTGIGDSFETIEGVCMIMPVRCELPMRMKPGQGCWEQQC